MSERAKITPAHTQRVAYVYIRQSTPAQVEQHRESTARQYALAARARELGWAPAQVLVIDEDLGLSGASSAKRAGFVRLTTEVALGHVGLILRLEVSRLARNNADWVPAPRPVRPHQYLDRGRRWRGPIRPCSMTAWSSVSRAP